MRSFPLLVPQGLFCHSYKKGGAIFSDPERSGSPTGTYRTLPEVYL